MSPKFYTDDGREVLFIAASFPEDDEWALAGARRVLLKTDEAINTDELISGLHAGRYWAFHVWIGDEEVAGVVTEVIVKRRSQEEQLDVMLIWGKHIRLWLTPALAAAKQLANDVGCARVRLGSPRWGWIKLLPPGRLTWNLEI